VWYLQIWTTRKECIYSVLLSYMMYLKIKQCCKWNYFIYGQRNWRVYYCVNTEMKPRVFGLWADILLTLTLDNSQLIDRLSANATQTTYRSILLTPTYRKHPLWQNPKIMLSLVKWFQNKNIYPPNSIHPSVWTRRKNSCHAFTLEIAQTAT